MEEKRKKKQNCKPSSLINRNALFYASPFRKLLFAEETQWNSRYASFHENPR